MNIARRFLFSKKSHSIVNSVARVSIFAVAVPVVALVFVLSLHNGLTDYVHGMYGKVDSDIQVAASKGGFFELDSTSYEELRERVGLVSRVLEGNALLRFGDRQLMVALRGVDTLYNSVVGIESTIVRGEWRLDFGGMPRAVLGAGVAYELAYGLSSAMPIHIYVIAPESSLMSYFPLPLYALDSIVGQGVFQLDKATDESQVFVPILFAQRLLGGQKDMVSSLEIKLKDGLSVADGKAVVSDILGEDVVVVGGGEQRGMIYRVMNVEKWIISLMLIFVALIAAISLAGCMLMMLSEKSDAIVELEVMGMSKSALRAIFLRLGMFIVGIGVGCGTLIGVILVVVQDQFGILTMGGESFLLSAYPVRVSFVDLLLIVLSVAFIGFCIVRVTVRSIIKNRV